MPVRELPREHISRLSYERFLREYALPRQPVIIEGVGAEWPAASAWCDLSYFLSHAGVDLEHEVAVHEGGAGADELECSVGEALRRLQQREESRGGAGGSGGGNEPPLYLSAWEYVRGGSEALQADFDVPPLFDRSPSWLAESAVLGSAAVDMKWLYLGQAGTGSATHVDTNMTSAWLWVARGEKEWVCAHGGDYAALLATAEQGEGDDEYKAPVHCTHHHPATHLANHLATHHLATHLANQTQTSSLSVSPTADRWRRWRRVLGTGTLLGAWASEPQPQPPAPAPTTSPSPNHQPQPRTRTQAGSLPRSVRRDRRSWQAPPGASDGASLQRLRPTPTCTPPHLTPLAHTPSPHP